ncbi:MAG: hypothetical protein IJQ74_01010 [Synergistaceae bacterium]|nr:hypothetical protein [Synergistaceae bacterium]MBQ6918884.1 hypothetical protein [Synergistaceae bacterium]MBQ6969581.1 hypothetical protein [Synergistaceae bacterium]MBQ7267289.1 hypothetical protein [Synergistaceae bacterium]
MKKVMSVVMLMCLTLIVFSGLAYAGKANHWICMNCGKKVSKESMPSLSGCSKAKTHAWVINYK